MTKNRHPGGNASEETEALYRVYLICRPEDVSQARDLLFEELERLHYPIREIETLSEGDGPVELAAVLVPTTAEPIELDAIANQLSQQDAVVSATGTVSAIH